MAKHCSACDAGLEGTEKFCGSCGAPVQAADNVQADAVPSPIPVEPAMQNQADAAPPSSPPPAPATKKKSLTLVQGLMVIALVFGVGIYWVSQYEGDPMPSSSRTTTGTPAVVSIPDTLRPAPTRSAPTSRAAPAISSAAQNYVDKVVHNYIVSGVAELAQHRLTVASCAECAPFMIYCVDPISSPADLRGRVVRAFPPDGTAFVKSHGGNAQLLSFSDVASAMQSGILDCSVSGGMVPN